MSLPWMLGGAALGGLGGLALGGLPRAVLGGLAGGAVGGLASGFSGYPYYSQGYYQGLAPSFNYAQPYSSPMSPMPMASMSPGYYQCEADWWWQYFHRRELALTQWLRPTMFGYF